MLRTLIIRLATVVLLTSALVVTAPAPSQARSFVPWGKVVSKNHVLKRGCHDYTYRYKITAPNNQWSAEIFFVSPNGSGLATALIDTNANPDAGKLKFTVCRPSTTVGRHRIKMKVTYNEDREVIDGFVKPSRFRFTRR